MSELFFDSEELFDLYLAPKLLLNDDVIIRSSSDIVENLPFISKLLKSKFKEGISINIVDDIINLQIPLIKLDISSDFIKLLETNYLFEGGDVGLYQDYLIAKGYGLNINNRDLFNLNKIDFESYFENFNDEIIDLYLTYFNEMNKKRFIIYCAKSLKLLKNKEKYQKQLRQFVIDFGIDINSILYIIKSDIFGKFSSQNTDIMVKTIIKFINGKLSFVTIKKIVNIIDYLGGETIKIKIKNVIYNNLNTLYEYSKKKHKDSNTYIYVYLDEKHIFGNIFISMIYPTIAKVEPDITNFFIKITQIIDQSSRSLINKLLYLYIDLRVGLIYELSKNDNVNLFIGILDSINKIANWDKLQYIKIPTNKYTDDLSSELNTDYSILQSLIDATFSLITLKDKRLTLKIKDFILKLFSLLSISDNWIEYMEIGLDTIASTSGDLEYEKVKKYIKTYLADDIIKMATKIKHPDLDGIKRIFNVTIDDFSIIS